MKFLGKMFLDESVLVPSATVTQEDISSEREFISYLMLCEYLYVYLELS